MRPKYILPEFGAIDGCSTNLLHISKETMESQKSECFENGYKAGWNDALKAQGDDHARISKELDNNLQNLSFTYHEAQVNVLKSLNPLLSQIVCQILPDIAHSTLGLQISNELTNLIKVDTKHKAQIVVSPGRSEVLTAMIANNFDIPLTFKEDPALGDGQATLSFGDIEKQIDLDEVISGISQAIDGFFFQAPTQPQEDMKHG